MTDPAWGSQLLIVQAYCHSSSLGTWIVPQLVRAKARWAHCPRCQLRGFVLETQCGVVLGSWHAYSARPRAPAAVADAVIAAVVVVAAAAVGQIAAAEACQMTSAMHAQC